MVLHKFLLTYARQKSGSLFPYLSWLFLKFSNSSFLVMCPISFSCLFEILSRSVLSIAIYSKTSFFACMLLPLNFLYSSVEPDFCYLQFLLPHPWKKLSNIQIRGWIYSNPAFSSLFLIKFSPFLSTPLSFRSAYFVSLMFNCISALYLPSSVKNASQIFARAWCLYLQFVTRILGFFFLLLITVLSVSLYLTASHFYYTP